MCATLPAKVISVNGSTAIVAHDGRQFDVERRNLPEAQPGSWVLIYAGQIIGLLSAEEAQALLELLQEVNSLR